MNAQPALQKIALLLRLIKIEAILIGNAAAALHGAPVTTLDFDFLFRATPQNLSKLKKLAKEMEAVILRPYYPVSSLYRVVSEDSGLQLDFMPNIHGIKSFASLRSRAATMKIGKEELLVASLDDIIKSKKAANRKTDVAVLPILIKTAQIIDEKSVKTERRKPKRK